MMAPTPEMNAKTTTSMATRIVPKRTLIPSPDPSELLEDAVSASEAGLSGDVGAAVSVVMCCENEDTVCPDVVRVVASIASVVLVDIIGAVVSAG